MPAPPSPRPRGFPRRPGPPSAHLRATIYYTITLPPVKPPRRACRGLVRVSVEIPPFLKGGLGDYLLVPQASSLCSVIMENSRPGRARIMPGSGPLLFSVDFCREWAAGKVFQIFQMCPMPASWLSAITVCLPPPPGTLSAMPIISSTIRLS